MDPSSISNSTLSNRIDNVLPLAPVLTPAFGVAGAILIITGSAFCFVGKNSQSLYGLLSWTYSFGLGVTVLVLETANLPVSHGIQGAYLVAIVLPALILGAVVSLLSADSAEWFGGFIGGFCIAMWFELLRPGGLIQSQLVAIWIVLASLVGCACTFGATFGARKSWSHAVSSAFAGATAIVLGVDCFSRADLKEFWVYTWRFRNDDIFSYPTTDYPLTRGIKAELGCLMVLFVFGLISQYKLYTPSSIKKILPERLSFGIHGRRGSDIEAPNEMYDMGSRSCVEVPQGEKKTPNVEQTQVYPDSPRQAGHRRSHGAANCIRNRPDSDARTLVATNDEQHQDDEISPVEVPADNTESNSALFYIRTLRPTSHPPRPIIPHSDDGLESEPSSDGIALVPFNSTRTSLPFLSDRVSSAALSRMLQDTEDSEGHGKINALTTPKEFQLDLFSWEQTSGDDDGDRKSAQESIQHSDHESDSKPRAQREGTNEQRQESESVLQSPKLPEAKPRGRKSSGSHVRKLSEMEDERKKEVMERTNEWCKAVVPVEPELRASSADEDTPSLWSGFEGTHTTDSIVDLTAGKGPTAPRLPESALARASPLKQKKRRSRRVSVVEGKTAILPAPVISARVHERNLSLPLLNTAANLLDHREKTLGQRRKHKSYTHELAVDGSAGHVAMKNFHSVGWVPPEEDDMTLAGRRASLQAARTMSSGQVSTVSSHVPYTPNSTRVQSTARTTPIASSPAHPPFITTAFPLRGAYPPPPGGELTPVSPYRYAIPSSVPNGINTATCFDNIPQPTIQENGLPTPHTQRIRSVPVQGAAPTLVNQIEEQEKCLKQQKEDREKAAQKAVEDTAKARKAVETQRRRTIQMEQMLRSGKYEDAHRENLRKMQRKATENANKAG
ncbi:hypothetical protein D6C80_01791 [Aureobasidium pullulans]|nr:hypothetical protein D6C80_01791 [Aureobasidium pullulans]